MDAGILAGDILKHVGGKENVRELTHCFTRLRFVLKDGAKVEREAIERLEGVIQTVNSGGQFQVVLGAKVTAVYEALVPMVEIRHEEPDGNRTDRKAPANRMNPTDRMNPTNPTDRVNPTDRMNRIIQTVSVIFTPLIPAIAASGLVKGLLTAARLLMVSRGIDISTADTYVLLYAASQVIFYFMPVFLGLTAAKAFRCNEIIAMTVGGFLCYPQLDAIIQDAAARTAVFGIPVMKGAWTAGNATRAFSYTESVIPILLAVFVLMYVERILKRWIPQMLQIILVPGISLVVMVPAVLCFLGPVGILVGNVIQSLYGTLVGFNAVIGGAVVGGLWSLLVIFGAHRALLPIGLNDVAVSGRQNLLAFAGAANFSQGGAALGVMLRTKNRELKGIAASAVISAAFVGITEPAVYGCNLRLKKPMACAILCGAVGGGIMGVGGVYGDAFANNGVLTVFTYAAFGMRQFLYYLAGCAVSFFGAAVLAYAVGFEDLADGREGKRRKAGQTG